MKYKVNYITPAKEIEQIATFETLGMAIEHHNYMIHSFIMKALESHKNTFRMMNDRRMSEEEVLAKYQELQREAYKSFAITAD